MDVKESRNPRYVAILAIVASLVLVLGWLARPRDIPEAPAPIPSQTELEQLARRTERRSLEEMTRYFEGLANEVSGSIARLPGAHVSGIAWDEQRIVTAALEGTGRSEAIQVVSAVGAVRARPAVWGPNLPIASLQAASARSGLSPARREPRPSRPGSWIVAVWRTEEGPAFAAGNFQQLGPAACAGTSIQEIGSSVSLTPTMLGGGLFDIEGNLLAVIARCDQQMTAIASASIGSILQRDTIEQRLLGRYGLTVGSLDAAEQKYFQVQGGLLVREVWAGYAGDAAGLRPGDVVTALAGRPVNTTADLGAMTAAEPLPFELTVRRGSKPVSFEFGAEPVGAAEPAAADQDGVLWEAAPRTFQVDAIRAGSREQRAGLQAGDRVVRIDSAEPRTLDQVKRRLSTPSPVLLEVARGRRRLAILVR